MMYDELHDLVLKAVSDMLQLSVDDDSDGRSLKTWKILIYDEETRALLSPILKVGTLRSLGVTLNLLISDRRESIPGVDAVYLLSPTVSNLDAIVSDAVSRKYKQMHINFTTYSSDDYLGELARRLVEANAHMSISSITDRYLHFTMVATSSFSLNLPGCFSSFYCGGAVNAEEGDALVNRVVDRLLSVIVTMGVLPVIVVPRTPSPALTVAEKLNAKLFEILNARHQLGVSLSSSFNRPLLLILDRTFDLSPMLQHSWNYQPLVHDVFGISFDKVVLDSVGDKGKRVTYDLEYGDKLYQSIISLPLSDVAQHIATSLESYNSQVSSINRDDVDTAGSLVTAMNAIPHLSEHKRLLDMHTNLATSLVDSVKSRELDRFYEFDYDVDILSEKNCFQQFEDLLSNDKCSAMDLYRSLLLIALHRPTIPDSRLDELENRVKLRGSIQQESLKGLRNVMKMKAFSEGILQQIGKAKAADLSSVKQINERGTEAPKKEYAQSHKRLAEYSSKLIDTGVNLFKGVRRLLPRKKQPCIVGILENLLGNSDKVAGEFSYFDPKTSDTALPTGTKRSTARRCIVFVVGGGSYNESLAIQDYSQRSKYSLLYGSTAFDRADDFVHQLGTFTFTI
ncbi:Sec1 family protein [Babesia bovis T2Bo]|uniref:Sec1 family protein n=1 Tax=Babesia bovis TaxID=5865 RepID=A7ATN1_BABBO|nr:Sec1 family protein [Babesia bovis T2Bo]EDO06292.1 Sec1 family protein [Babesia bovis T2Bo]|eukprot:XP_001609860.1 Sec1 family protein [Babesia bovis T2Bo]